MLQWFGMDKMPVLRDWQTNIEAYSRYPCTQEATVLNSVRKRLLHAGEHSGQACCYVESEATPAADEIYSTTDMLNCYISLQISLVLSKTD